MKWARKQIGFTIVELLIVIVVIAILAAITIVAYNGITGRATEAAMQSDLRGAATALGVDNAVTGSYPSDESGVNDGQGLKSSADNILSYSKTETGYCVAVSNPKVPSTYHITESGAIQEGDCPPAPPTPIQTVTNANCPTTRTLTVDARDNHTYWVQKLADGRCWMLTNLAYAGGGTNTYGDTRVLVNGEANGLTYTTASYYVVPSTTNYTTSPDSPSTSGNGIGQYGYLYNWCGAMGGQATAACANASTPSPNPSISACPAGWRLPVGGVGGEFAALNGAINGGSTSSPAGLLSAWLGQWSGIWNGAPQFHSQGNGGQYWSSTQATSTYAAYRMILSSTSVDATTGLIKNYGAAVRCVAY